jgi:hypothetical protein
MLPRVRALAYLNKMISPPPGYMGLAKPINAA